MPHLLSINVSAAKTIKMGKRTSKTGIFKETVEGPVRVKTLGVEGDVQVNRRHHGGPDQAVYLYTREDYRYWEQRLNRCLAPGTFGENLTVTHFGPEPVRIGDRLRIGEVELEASAPRIPCATLASRVEEPAFARWFLEEGRLGFYARVLQPGTLQAGLPVLREHAPREAPTVLALARLFLDSKADSEHLAAALRWPVAERVREHFKARLGAPA